MDKKGGLNKKAGGDKKAPRHQSSDKKNPVEGGMGKNNKVGYF